MLASEAVRNEGDKPALTSSTSVLQPSNDEYDRQEKLEDGQYHRKLYLRPWIYAEQGKR